MKKIIIARSDKDKGMEHPYEVEKRVRDLLGSNAFGYEGFEIPLRTNSLSELLNGCIIGDFQLYELNGGVALYQEIDDLNSKSYIGHIILLGFGEDNKIYQELKSKLEELASKNPEGFKKTIQEIPIIRGIKPTLFSN